MIWICLIAIWLLLIGGVLLIISGFELKKQPSDCQKNKENENKN